MLLLLLLLLPLPSVSISVVFPERNLLLYYQKTADDPTYPSSSFPLKSIQIYSDTLHKTSLTHCCLASQPRTNSAMLLLSVSAIGMDLLDAVLMLLTWRGKGRYLLQATTCLLGWCVFSMEHRLVFNTNVLPLYPPCLASWWPVVWSCRAHHDILSFFIFCVYSWPSFILRDASSDKLQCQSTAFMSGNASCPKLLVSTCLISDFWSFVGKSLEALRAHWFFVNVVAHFLKHLACEVFAFEMPDSRQMSENDVVSKLYVLKTPSTRNPLFSSTSVNSSLFTLQHF